MALTDPVAVYNAATNVEAHLLCHLLVEAGVEAFVTEDVSPVGTWIGGLIPEIHKPQVWVDRADIERAKPVLDDYEHRSAERRNSGVEEPTAGPPIEAVCEECGRSASFPPTQRGSVQQCPHCGAYLDVGGEEMPADWSEGQGEEETAEEP